MVDLKESNIGLAMSGGGLRATVFNLGVLTWLAEQEALENVRRISTVAGGSLCVGLVYAFCNNRWPTSEQFTFGLPYIRKALLESDLQKQAIQRLAYSPQYWSDKANLLGQLMAKKWGLTAKLSELPEDPRWYINCTTYETGKRFRFTQTDMGDYSVGYANNHDITLADAMAASVGFPVLLGPYMLDVTRYRWERSASQTSTFRASGGSQLHLWDGSVSDSLALEPVYSLEEKGAMAEGLDFMIISSATGSGPLPKADGMRNSKVKRLLDIATEQAAILRRQTITRHMEEQGNGLLLTIGNSADYIAKRYEAPDHIAQELVAKSIATSEAWRMRKLPIGLGQMSGAEYDILLRHGYEVANCTYDCIHATEEELVPKPAIQRLMETAPPESETRGANHWKIRK